MANDKVKYKAAVIGCGRIGCGFDDDPKRKNIATHAKAYQILPNTELVALCDIDEKKLEEYGKKFNVNTYLDYKELFSTEKIDILSICTLNFTHLPIIEEGLRRKEQMGLKAIFCEKPIADSLGNAQKIIDLCEKNKVLLIIDHQRRFDPFHNNVRDYIRSGKLGKIQQATFYYSAGISNTGTHVFDLLRFFLGEVDWVSAFKSEIISPNESDPNLDGFVKFKNGGICSLQACSVKDYMLFELDILGTKGRIKILNSGFRCEYYSIKESEYYSGYLDLQQDNIPFQFDTPRDYMINAIKHIVSCINEGKQPLSVGDDGKKALELITAFHLSANEKGKKIYLPLSDQDTYLNSK